MFSFHSLIYFTEHLFWEGNKKIDLRCRRTSYICYYHTILVVCTPAMLLNDKNNRNHFRKNRVLFPKDGNFSVLSSNLAAVQILGQHISKSVYIINDNYNCPSFVKESIKSQSQCNLVPRGLSSPPPPPFLAQEGREDERPWERGWITMVICCWCFPCSSYLCSDSILSSRDSYFHFRFHPNSFSENINTIITY